MPAETTDLTITHLKSQLARMQPRPIDAHVYNAVRPLRPPSCIYASSLHSDRHAYDDFILLKTSIFKGDSNRKTSNSRRVGIATPIATDSCKNYDMTHLETCENSTKTSSISATRSSIEAEYSLTAYTAVCNILCSQQLVAFGFSHRQRLAAVNHGFKLPPFIRCRPIKREKFVRVRSIC